MVWFAFSRHVCSFLEELSDLIGAGLKPSTSPISLLPKISASQIDVADNRTAHED
jgi:hypothetical protein